MMSDNLKMLYIVTAQLQDSNELCAHVHNRLLSMSPEEVYQLNKALEYESFKTPQDVVNYLEHLDAQGEV